MFNLQLTEGEADVLLPCALDAAIRYATAVEASGREPNDDDYDTLWKCQVIAKKIQRMIGMPDALFAAMLAAIYGTPSKRVYAYLIEAQRRFGGRQ